MDFTFGQVIVIVIFGAVMFWDDCQYKYTLKKCKERYARNNKNDQADNRLVNDFIFFYRMDSLGRNNAEERELPKIA